MSNPDFAPNTSEQPRLSGALPTYFAPAERETEETLKHQKSCIEQSRLVSALLDAGPTCILILNSKRQVIASGERILSLVHGLSLDQILGLRPGEVVGCSHAHECAGGCGTSKHCRDCGAARAILAAIDGNTAQQECRLNQVRLDGNHDALDLLVQATPFVVGGEHFVILALSDISHEKRRKTLEKVFFHDIINLAGGVQGLLDTLVQLSPADLEPLVSMALSNTRDMVEEILVQRDLVAAERDELKVSPSTLNAVELLKQIAMVYQAHPVSLGKQILLSPEAESISIRSDPILLKRIVGNMVKNAAEASPIGGKITLHCTQKPVGHLHLSVHNEGHMPASVQNQVFQRSFTTKGEGRGLGTYSIKLLGERYLKGKVGFLSQQEAGTHFFVVLPAAI